MPRVLIVAATDLRRGAEVFTVRLGQGLADRGWDVETVSLTRSGGGGSGLDPLTSVDPSRAGRFSPTIARALVGRIREAQPDVVVANGGSTLRYGAAATLSTEAPLAYIAIGEPRYWTRSALSRSANRRMLRRARLILAVCDATRGQLLELEPDLAGRTHVAYTGVPDEMFDVRGSNSEGPLRVAFIGSLSAEKDPLLALQTIASVPDSVLRFVGGGSLHEQVAREAEALGVSDRVELTGPVEDVRPHLGWANVLLLTSHTEGLPGTVLEAGAASVAAVAVDVGGVSEAVRHGITGLVVERDRPGALAEALNTLAGDRSLLRRMGKAAKLHIKKSFALDQIVSGYAVHLSSVIE